MMMMMDEGRMRKLSRKKTKIHEKFENAWWQLSKYFIDNLSVVVAVVSIITHIERKKSRNA